MKLIKKLIAFLCLVVLVVSAFLFGVGWIKYKQVTETLSITDAIKLIQSDENYTVIDNISPTFVNAMVAVEDRRFYKHSGIDVYGIFRAVMNNFEKRELTEGGSCITQQLAKNMYFINDNSFSRKIAEMFISVQIEKNYTKEEILEFYFNVIYYGSGYYNVYEASEGYFGKEPSELSDYEATLLAGIPNAPSVYSLDNNPDLAKKRQKTVVRAMVNMGCLSENEASQIIEEQ